MAARFLEKYGPRFTVKGTSYYNDTFGHSQTLIQIQRILYCKNVK